MGNGWTGVKGNYVGERSFYTMSSRVLSIDDCV